MYLGNQIQKVLLVSTVMLAGTIFVTPAIAQGYNFVELNQSRQFFDRGHRNLEEIDELEKIEQLPEIKLTQDYRKPQNQNNDRHYLYSRQKLQPWSSTPNSDIWQTETPNDRDF